MAQPAEYHLSFEYIRRWNAKYFSRWQVQSATLHTPNSIISRTREWNAWRTFRNENSAIYCSQPEWVGLLRARAFHTHIFLKSILIIIIMFFIFVDGNRNESKKLGRNGIHLDAWRVKCKQNAKGSKLISFVIHFTGTVLHCYSVLRSSDEHSLMYSLFCLFPPLTVDDSFLVLPLIHSSFFSCFVCAVGPSWSTLAAHAHFWVDLPSTRVGSAKWKRQSHCIMASSGSMGKLLHVLSWDLARFVEICHRHPLTITISSNFIFGYGVKPINSSDKRNG